MCLVSTPQSVSSASIHNLSPPPTPGPKRARFPNDFGVVPLFFPTSCSLLIPEEKYDCDEEEIMSRRMRSLNDLPAPTFTLRARPVFGTKIIEHKKGDSIEISESQLPSLPFDFLDLSPKTGSDETADPLERKSFSTYKPTSKYETVAEEKVVEPPHVLAMPESASSSSSSLEKAPTGSVAAVVASAPVATKDEASNRRSSTSSIRRKTVAGTADSTLRRSSTSSIRAQHQKLPSFQKGGMFHDRKRNSFSARCA